MIGSEFNGPYLNNVCDHAVAENESPAAPSGGAVATLTAMSSGPKAIMQASLANQRMGRAPHSAQLRSGQARSGGTVAPRLQVGRDADRNPRGGKLNRRHERARERHAAAMSVGEIRPGGDSVRRRRSSRDRMKQPTVPA